MSDEFKVESLLKLLTSHELSPGQRKEVYENIKSLLNLASKD